MKIFRKNIINLDKGFGIIKSEYNRIQEFRGYLKEIRKKESEDYKKRIKKLRNIQVKK